MSFPGSQRELPTKINLIRLKQRLKTVKRIRKLLEDKREILLMYLRAAIEEYQRYSEEYEKHLREAYKYYVKALAQSGYLLVKQDMMVIPDTLSVDFKTRVAFGVKVPVMVLKEESVPPMLSTSISSSPYLDAAYLEMRKALSALVKAITAENTMYKLMEELRRTQRLINAIKYSVIPSIENNIKYIKLVLDDRAREEFIRLKLIRAKLRERKL